MTDLEYTAAFIGARLGEWEAWALAASKPYPYADGEPPVPPGGVHWQWGAGENWEPAEPDLSKDVVDDYGHNVQLLTVETWPAREGLWQMHRAYSDHVCEMDSAAGPTPCTARRSVLSRRGCGGSGSARQRT